MIMFAKTQNVTVRQIMRIDEWANQLTKIEQIGNQRRNEYIQVGSGDT